MSTGGGHEAYYLMNSETGEDTLERSDEALIMAHCQGDETAMGELVARYATPLLNYLARMTGDRGEAEDLFQETFLRVHSNARSFRQASRFKPWLFTIATRVAIDAIRKRCRRPAFVSWDKIEGDRVPANQNALRATDSNPGSDMLRSEKRELVKQAVESLPARQRAALVLSYYQGLSYSEVAKVMKCSTGTIKTHMSRALGTLARLLPDMEGGAT